MRQNPHVRICGGPGSATTLAYPTVKTGGQFVKHARYYWLLLAEGHLHRRLFSDMLRRLWALPLPAGWRVTG